MDKVYEQAFRKQKEDEKRKRKANSSWGSLAPPAGDDAKKSKGPPVREYPAAPFTLRRVAGKSGRNAYENMQKLEVLKFSRQKCSDGNPVGRRGAGKVFGINKKLIRDWESQEAELIAFSKQKTASKQRTLRAGREPSTKEVETAVVDEINTLRKNGAAVTADVVMGKLLQEMPTFQGGLPSAGIVLEEEGSEEL